MVEGEILTVGVIRFRFQVEMGETVIAVSIMLTDAGDVNACPIPWDEVRISSVSILLESDW